MSSPIVDIQKSLLKKGLIKIHEKISHSHRLKILEEKCYQLITDQICDSYDNTFKCLDVGCGNMVLAEKLEQRIPNSLWKCIDIHELPKSMKSESRWIKYLQFDGRNIPFADQSFDLILLCDVLHHSGEHLIFLLKEAARVAKYVIVKDHFEFGFFSRKTLQLMDIVGNWGYGVSIPKQYFTEESWDKCIEESNLRVVNTVHGIELYEHLYFLPKILKSKWQFIAILSSARFGPGHFEGV